MFIKAHFTRLQTNNKRNHVKNSKTFVTHVVHLRMSQDRSLDISSSDLETFVSSLTLLPYNIFAFFWYSSFEKSLCHKTWPEAHYQLFSIDYYLHSKFQEKSNSYTCKGQGSCLFLARAARKCDQVWHWAVQKALWFDWFSTGDQAWVKGGMLGRKGFSLLAQKPPKDRKHKPKFFTKDIKLRHQQKIHPEKIHPTDLGAR